MAGSAISTTTEAKDSIGSELMILKGFSGKTRAEREKIAADLIASNVLFYLVGDGQTNPDLRIKAIQKILSTPHAELNNEMLRLGAIKWWVVRCASDANPAVYIEAIDRILREQHQQVVNSLVSAEAGEKCELDRYIEMQLDNTEALALSITRILRSRAAQAIDLIFNKQLNLGAEGESISAFDWLISRPDIRDEKQKEIVLDETIDAVLSSSSKAIKKIVGLLKDYMWRGLRDGMPADEGATRISRIATVIRNGTIPSTEISSLQDELNKARATLASVKKNTAISGTKRKLPEEMALITTQVAKHQNVTEAGTAIAGAGVSMGVEVGVFHHISTLSARADSAAFTRDESRSSTISSMARHLDTLGVMDDDTPEADEAPIPSESMVLGALSHRDVSSAGTGSADLVSEVLPHPSSIFSMAKYMLDADDVLPGAEAALPGAPTMLGVLPHGDAANAGAGSAEVFYRPSSAWSMWSPVLGSRDEEADPAFGLRD